jgi:hypothetical protein
MGVAMNNRAEGEEVLEMGYRDETIIITGQKT